MIRKSGPLGGQEFTADAAGQAPAKANKMAIPTLRLMLAIDTIRSSRADPGSKSARDALTHLNLYVLRRPKG